MKPNRLSPLSRRVLAVCRSTPQSAGEIISQLPGEDKEKVADRLSHLVCMGYLQNHRSVRSYGGLYSLPEERIKREIRPTPVLGTSTFPLYDVWR